MARTKRKNAQEPAGTIEQEPAGTIERLCRPRDETPNVPHLDAQRQDDGNRCVGPASAELRAMAQNVIDDVDEHRHLREARVMLLVERSAATAARLEKGERVSAGKASKLTPVQRVMTSRGDEPGYDFVIRLSGDCLERIGFAEPPEERPADAIGQVLPLLDHELLHCSTRILGEWIDRGAKLTARVAELGGDHLETCDDIEDGKGRVLIRYRQRKDGRYVWAVRKHDLEEFRGVAERWGAWRRDVAELVDAIVRREPPGLFDEQTGKALVETAAAAIAASAG